MKVAANVTRLGPVTAVRVTTTWPGRNFFLITTNIHKSGRITVDQYIHQTRHYALRRYGNDESRPLNVSPAFESLKALLKLIKGKTVC